jgi:hypothetical protein
MSCNCGFPFLIIFMLGKEVGYILRIAPNFIGKLFKALPLNSCPGP